MTTPSELSLPVVLGARVVALELLGTSSRASDRLTGAERDPEALHDFRVAVRRLRSWVRAFDDELDVRKRHKKCLRAIAHATNPGRDVEVQLDWLREAGARRGKSLRQGVAWMTAVLERRRDVAEAGVGERLASEFADLRADLEQRFTLSDGSSPDDRTDSQQSTLAIAIADRIERGSAELRHALGKVHSITDDVAAHEARIAGKRLRYLIEPAVPQARGGDALLRQLEKLQDDLGELHDRYVMAHQLCVVAERSAVLAARQAVSSGLGEFGARLLSDAANADRAARDDIDPDDPDPHAATLRDVQEAAPARALVVLAGRLRADMASQYARARKRWLANDHTSLDDRLAAFADRLRSDFPV